MRHCTFPVLGVLTLSMLAPAQAQKNAPPTGKAPAPPVPVVRPPLTMPGSVAAFEHEATGGNIQNNWTVIDNSELNGKPDRILVVTRLGKPGTKLANIGVWYTNGKWTIFHQDKSPMKAGEQFVVEAFAPGRLAFSVTATPSGHMMAVGNPTLDSRPETNLFVTPVYNGIYDDHPFGVWHDGTRWQIFHQNRAPMPTGATFHVVALPASRETSTDENTDPQGLAFETPGDSLLSISPIYTGAYVTAPFSAFYSGSRWRIGLSGDAEVPAGATFAIRRAAAAPLKAVTTTTATLAPLTGRFRVTLTGVTCVTETADDILERDGKGDEIYLSVATREYDAQKQVRSSRRIKSVIYGDVNRPGTTGWVQAGSRSDRGGIRSGDTFPTLEPWNVSGPLQDDRLPLRLWEGPLSTDGSAAYVALSLWEWDNDTTEYNQFLRWDFAGPYSGLRSVFNELGTGYGEYSGRNGGDRMIGGRDRSLSGRSSSWVPVLQLNYGTAAKMAALSSPHGPGRFTIDIGKPTRFRSLRITYFGHYRLHFLVERLP
jgi:hypothetical protein